MTPPRIRRHRAAALDVQRGQALVLGIVMLGVAMVALLRYAATAHTVGARAKQTHALDAAAYSGALTQARALNMLAYINRAHLGHQVAMAHLVTLATWAQLGTAESAQAASGNPPVHLISLFFGPQHGAAYAAARRASGLTELTSQQGGLAQAYARHDSTITGVLAKIQDEIALRLPENRMHAMQAVLRQNYPAWPPGVPFSLQIDDDTWSQTVARHAPSGTLRPWLEDLVQVFEFLSPRNRTARNAWAVDARCPTRRHELRRRGATQLDDTGRWQSADTQSLHALRSNKWIGCYFREYAMGWGWVSSQGQRFDGDYVDNPPDNFGSQDFWRWVHEATDWDIASGQDNPLANSRAVTSRARWPGGGLPAYWDVPSGRPDPVAGFSVVLEHPGPEGLRITTRSAAQTYFARPSPRADGLAERANLFHAFWEARLAAHPDNGARPTSSAPEPGVDESQSRKGAGP